MAMQVCVHTALAAAASLLVRVGGRAAGLQAAGLPWQAGRRPLQGKQASQGKGLAGELGGGRHTSALLRLEAPPRACCLRWKQLVGGLAGELAGIYSAYNIQHNFAI